MSSEMEMKSILIDNYKMLVLIRKEAAKENATETVKKIDRELNCIKLKLQPLDLSSIDE